MLFSRLWMALLALTACLALGTASLMRQTYLHDRESDTGALLGNDRRVVEELLRREARTRLDDLTPVSANPQLVTLLEGIRTRANDDAATIGQAVLTLGAGRSRADDSIDPTVGIDHLRKTGTPVKAGDALCRIHARSQADAATAASTLATAFSIA